MGSSPRLLLSLSLQWLMKVSINHFSLKVAREKGRPTTEKLQLMRVLEMPLPLNTCLLIPTKN